MLYFLIALLISFSCWGSDLPTTPSIDITSSSYLESEEFHPDSPKSISSLHKTINSAEKHTPIKISDIENYENLPSRPSPEDLINCLKKLTGHTLDMSCPDTAHELNRLNKTASLLRFSPTFQTKDGPKNIGELRKHCNLPTPPFSFLSLFSSVARDPIILKIGGGLLGITTVGCFLYSISQQSTYNADQQNLENYENLVRDNKIIYQQTIEKNLLTVQSTEYLQAFTTDDILLPYLRKCLHLYKNFFYYSYTNFPNFFCQPYETIIETLNNLSPKNGGNFSSYFESTFRTNLTTPIIEYLKQAFTNLCQGKFNHLHFINVTPASWLSLNSVDENILFMRNYFLLPHCLAEKFAAQPILSPPTFSDAYYVIPLITMAASWGPCLLIFFLGWFAQI